MVTEQQKRIDAYLAKTMTKEEEKAFMLDCSRDKALNQQLFMTGMLMRMLQ